MLYSLWSFIERGFFVLKRVFGSVLSHCFFYYDGFVDWLAVKSDKVRKSSKSYL